MTDIVSSLFGMSGGVPIGSLWEVHCFCFSLIMKTIARSLYGRGGQREDPWEGFAGSNVIVFPFLWRKYLLRPLGGRRENSLGGFGRSNIIVFHFFFSIKEIPTSPFGRWKGYTLGGCGTFNINVLPSFSGRKYSVHFLGVQKEYPLGGFGRSNINDFFSFMQEIATSPFVRSGWVLFGRFWEVQ